MVEEFKEVQTGADEVLSYDIDPEGVEEEEPKGLKRLFRAGPLGFSPARSEIETPADATSFAALRTDAGDGGGGIFDFRRVRLRVAFPAPYAATVSARSAFARGDAPPPSPPPESRVRGELERDAEPGDGLSV